MAKVKPDSGLKYSNLPSRQLQVFIFIEREIDDKGVAPSLQEIADGNGMILAQAQQIVNALESKGKIKTTPHKARSIEIVKQK